ncbi:hypothetical protein JAAARDRAFT_32919 [Jaapia argillacea MUCL 33604]|uniref:Uncharacterized protein n=1 Tax=Jaapia argillacea MUCL 33604 TaxID=933084 RepID=A0A067QAI0_9AGAM|nr:hypothetical protein JAAARDRAFT_32919 [Jaapia argillacea MUCL 33604]
MPANAPFPRQTRRPVGDYCTCGCVLFLIFLIVHITDALLVYYYGYTFAHPYPRNDLNRTMGHWQRYTWLMWIFTVFLGFSDVVVFCFVVMKSKNDCAKCILAPIGLCVTVMVFYMPFIIESWAETYAWHHGCIGAQMQVVLQASPCYGPANFAVAHYFIGNSPVYTYQLVRQPSNFLNFSLQTIDSSSLATNFSSLGYPSIQSIAYDFVSKTIVGNCTSTAAAPNSTFPCLSGSFYPSNNYLSFNLTDFRANSSTAPIYLRAVDKNWFFSEEPPRVVLKDGDGMTVLETDVASQCTALKLCMRSRGAGPETIVPVALVLWKQMDFASYCDCGHHEGALV